MSSAGPLTLLWGVTDPQVVHRSLKSQHLHFTETVPIKHNGFSKRGGFLRLQVSDEKARSSITSSDNGSPHRETTAF